VGVIGFDPVLFAPSKIILDSLLECAVRLLDRGTVEVEDVLNADHEPMEHAGSAFGFDPGTIAPVFPHVMPAPIGLSETDLLCCADSEIGQPVALAETSW